MKAPPPSVPPTPEEARVALRHARQGPLTPKDEATLSWLLFNIPALLAERPGMVADRERLNWLEAWTEGDQEFCPPGNHGGNAANWLFARESASRADRHGKWFEEWEGDTLRAAIDAARVPSEPPEKTTHG